MMRIAYTALHYGSPYLAAAIRSVIDIVDKYYVLYVAQGSHGTRNTMRLPESDTRIALQKIAHEAAGNKLLWVDGDWQHEGQQRDAIHEICPEADAILVLDYDEIWADGLAYDVINNYALPSDRQKFRVPMVHFWRSFRRCVLHDPAYPIRIITKDGEGEATASGERKIAHMGYAIPDWLLRYKMSIHGHKGELRQDGWYANRWMANEQRDCHPVGSEFWNPEPVNPFNYLPHWMMNHPLYQYEVIP